MKKWALLEENLLELIRRTSTDLPADVESALRRSCARAKPGSRARGILETILSNVAAARDNDAPICQDTGTLLFYFTTPPGIDPLALMAATRKAVAQATSEGYLRENTIDALNNVPSPTNVGNGAPVFNFEPGARDTIRVRLMMKGGGSENMSAQYSLPDDRLKAGRDLEGVRRCVLDALVQAQGNGCAPGILGVCIGGDRATGYAHAKEQLLRRLDERSDVIALRRLEDRLLRESERLGIGPMGLGGASTLLGVKVGALSRLPASYFVTISYMCWAMRRRGVVLAPNGGVRKWLY